MAKRFAHQGMRCSRTRFAQYIIHCYSSYFFLFNAAKIGAGFDFCCSDCGRRQKSKKGQHKLTHGKSLAPLEVRL